MKTYQQCLECFKRQAKDACKIAGLSKEETFLICDRINREINSFPNERPPVEMAKIIHRTVRQVSGTNDPYTKVKQQANTACRDLLPVAEEVVRKSTSPWETALKLAIGGNMIDAGAFTITSIQKQDIQSLIKVVTEESLTGNTPEELTAKIKRAERILFIGDNTGECFFDRLILEQLPLHKVTYAVRGGPILNDATMEDALDAGIDKLCPLVDTGDNAPGVLREHCSEAFINTWDASDLVIAKGQGNYESLSDYHDRTYAFLTKVKCEILAADIRFPTGSSVIKINEKRRYKMGSNVWNRNGGNVRSQPC